MTAEEAYNKTTELLKAYEQGDLIGGNPFCHIEAYAQRSQPQALSEEVIELKAWKQSAIELNKKWDLVQEFIQNHPSVKIGDSISEKALELLKSSHPNTEAVGKAVGALEEGMKCIKPLLNQPSSGARHHAASVLDKIMASIHELKQLTK